MGSMDNRGAALVAVGGGIIIFAIKLGAWYISGSVALLSDALESIINIAASCLMLYSVHVSGRPADDEHHYGHQKVEYITSLTEGGLIITAAIFIIHTALERLSNPVPITSVESAVGINLFATAMNGGLSWYLSRRSRETGSILPVYRLDPSRPRNRPRSLSSHLTHGNEHHTEVEQGPHGP